MIHSIDGADAVILVTEPTPFGLHDLKLAVSTLRSFSSAYFGVVINRCNIGDERVKDYCNQESIPILLQIPESRKIAEAYAQGISLLQTLPEYRPLLKALLLSLRQKTGKVI
jgi:MinD superfamily P-loop ATPase